MTSTTCISNGCDRDRARTFFFYAGIPVCYCKYHAHDAMKTLKSAFKGTRHEPIVNEAYLKSRRWRKQCLKGEKGKSYAERLGLIISEEYAREAKELDERRRKRVRDGTLGGSNLYRSPAPRLYNHRSTK